MVYFNAIAIVVGVVVGVRSGKPTVVVKATNVVMWNVCDECADG